MSIKELKEFIADSPDDYHFGLSGDFDPEGDMYLVLLNGKLQPVKTLSMTAPATEYMVTSQLQELDVNHDC